MSKKANVDSRGADRFVSDDGDFILHRGKGKKPLPRVQRQTTQDKAVPRVPLPKPLERLDVGITTWMARNAVPITRVALGVVFLWFGVIKFVPSWSPASELAAHTIERLTFGLVQPAVSLPILAAWESLIDLGLLTGRFLRATLLLLFLQMPGTMLPLILFPAETFNAFPHAPTLEGQYIIKNLVLVGAATVVGATVRGGQLRAKPER